MDTQACTSDDKAIIVGQYISSVAGIIYGVNSIRNDIKAQNTQTTYSPDSNNIKSQLSNLRGKTIFTGNNSYYIPEDWIAEPSDTPGGYNYRNPANPKFDYIRVSPGSPNSPYPNSQVPYVRIFNQQYRDDYGNIVDNRASEGHIPISDNK